MNSPPATGLQANYAGRLLALAGASFAQLMRAPSHSRRAEAARRSARHAVLLTAVIAVVIVTLMYAFDAQEISLMPVRGTPSLWPFRILTDFGKDEYVLGTLAALLLFVAIVAPAVRAIPRSLLLRLGTHLQFLFFAVLLSVLTGELIKWIVGRGRPFVGGKANPFNFSHFAGTEAYSSFPSGHSITACALAFAIASVWPRARNAVIVYALVIVATRLVLLAHHPSDVVAGALVGIIGAMTVRYWFAARRLGFAIRSDGTIVPLAGPSPDRLKRVARGAFAS